MEENILLSIFIRNSDWSRAKVLENDGPGRRFRWQRAYGARMEILGFVAYWIKQRINTDKHKSAPFTVIFATVTIILCVNDCGVDSLGARLKLQVQGDNCFAAHVTTSGCVKRATLAVSSKHIWTQRHWCIAYVVSPRSNGGGLVANNYRVVGIMYIGTRYLF